MELSAAGIGEPRDDASSMSSVDEINQHSEESESELSDVSNNSSSSVVTFTHILGTVNTQSKCFVCDSPAGRNVTPWPAIQQVWFEKKCYIPKSNRTCKEHLTEWKTFNAEALEKIEATKQGLRVKCSDFELWLHEVSNLPKSTPYNFENGAMDPSKYKTFCGISKEDFDDLIEYLHGKKHFVVQIPKDYKRLH